MIGTAISIPRKTTGPRNIRPMETLFGTDECPVCLAELTEPKILQCLHTFCQMCLAGIVSRVKENEIRCPICREVSMVPKKGVKGLPSKPFSLKLSTYGCAMPNCKERTKTYCRECNRQFCEQCSEKHVQHKIFQNHNLQKICGAHELPLKYICLECMKGMCTDCTFQHDDLSHTIEEIQSGRKYAELRIGMEIKYLKTKLNNLELSLRAFDRNEEIAREADRLKTRIDSMVRNITLMLDRRQKEDLPQYTATLMEARQVIDDADSLMKSRDENFVSDMHGIHVKAKELSTEISRLTPVLQRRGSLRLDYGATIFERIVAAIKKVTDEYLVSLLVLIQCGSGYNILKPWRVSVLEDNSALVNDTKRGAVIVVDIYGNIKKKPLDQEFPSYATCTSGQYIYFAGKDGDRIGRCDQSFKLTQVVLSPPSPAPWGIGVTGTDIYTMHGKGVMKYSIDGKGGKEIIREAGLESFALVSVDGKPHIILTTYDSHEVLVYSCEGTLKHRFGGQGEVNGKFNQPRGLTQLPNGNILVADWKNHRICEFKINGDFVRHVLTEDNGLHYPVDVAYTRNHLWVTEFVTLKSQETKGSFKLFKYG